MGSTTQNIIDYLGNTIGTLTLPDTTTGAQFAAALAPYAASPATIAAAAAVQQMSFPTLTYAPIVPTRSIGTAFQPNANYATLVFYTVSISCTTTLISSQTGTIQLLSDASTTPTTIRAATVNASSVSIALTVVNTQSTMLCYVVPPGHYVKLVSAGTATMSIMTQSEVTLQQGS